jgi:hypothetical protein
MTLLLGVHSWVSGSDVRVLGAATRKEPVLQAELGVSMDSGTIPAQIGNG